MAANNVVYEGQIVIDPVNHGIGANDVFVSDKLSLQNVNSLEVVAKYSNNIPDPETTVARYNLVTILEEEIAPGKWRPFQSQSVPYVKMEQGQTNILTFGKDIFNLDPEVPFDTTDGTNIISRQYRQQGYLADEFRIRVVANCYVLPGETGCFESADLEVSYKTYNV